MKPKLKIRRALLCLDGEPPSKKLFNRVRASFPFVIAADGAANWLKKYSITPDVIIGDFDGIQKAILDSAPPEKIVYRPSQYSTDMEKALIWAIENLFTYVTIVGLSGKRIDHTLANFSLVWRYEKKISIEIVHDGWIAQLVRNEKKQFDTKKGKTVSFIPASRCRGITLVGFQYPLRNAQMDIGEVGVSNVATRSKVQVQVNCGQMIAIFLT